MSIKEVIIEKLEKLPLDKQQEVLEFIKVLQSNVPQPNINKDEQKSVSFLVAAQEFAGCVDGGPGDLATNKKHLEGLGTE
ncbi:hypothetical protein C7Y66_14605 [Chroococcidiopsis sp. CCALA 051]|uniref:DUF2281 domain-containing protein n=1 Tax=Chroococcidiopsis sp. CCALA 051 TaxID=869949 RepID=UPI000D0D41EC|nr:DUF2281 domain-containing protein [Chroococcidiopsis sp. CCALA 051]MBE9017316.1 DUF2281 domain-containing protein [Chroococcidiopsidales cyanobacterium LEGE 13417]PSM48447.1 hypothetical protein C7Y66_14605 [Chroococcidiopsis sp. CCALA 051]